MTDRITMKYDPSTFHTIRKLGLLGLWETAEFCASEKYNGLHIYRYVGPRPNTKDLFMTWIYRTNNDGSYKREGSLLVGLGEKLK